MNFYVPNFTQLSVFSNFSPFLVSNFALCIKHTIKPLNTSAMKKSLLKLCALLIVMFIVITLNSCVKEDPIPEGSNEVIINNSITRSVSWSADSIYVVSGAVYVGDGATLTIQPGTVIRFNAGASLHIASSNNATIIANGTVEKPIIFTSNAPNPVAGAWDGIYFYQNTLQNTVLNYCVIEYAGGNETGALNLYNCDITITNSIIYKALYAGISSQYDNGKGGFVTFSNNKLEDISGYAIEMDANKLHTIEKNNEFTNTHPILITGFFNSTTARKWNKLQIPYVIDHELSIDGDLTLEAGTTFKFNASGLMSFGYNKSTKLTAIGTNEEPIEFTSNSLSPAAGAWRGFEFYSHTLANTNLSYCIFNYTGKDYERALQMYDATINFTNNSITNCSGMGIKLNSEKAGFGSFKSNTISCTDHVISISSQRLSDLGVLNNFTPGLNKGIEVFGSAYFPSLKTWKKQEMADLYIDEAMYLDGNLTIEAGTVFKMGGNGYFLIGYEKSTTIKAIGTADQPIVFTSELEDPAPGSWQGIQFYANCTLNTVFEYCHFMYGGKNGYNTLKAYANASLTMNNCQIYFHEDSDEPMAVRQEKTTIKSLTGNNFEWVLEEWK
jgi:hypothetical protein